MYKLLNITKFLILIPVEASGVRQCKSTNYFLFCNFFLQIQTLDGWMPYADIASISRHTLPSTRKSRIWMEHPRSGRRRKAQRWLDARKWIENNQKKGRLRDRWKGIKQNVTSRFDISVGGVVVALIAGITGKQWCVGSDDDGKKWKGGFFYMIMWIWLGYRGRVPTGRFYFVGCQAPHCASLVRCYVHYVRLVPTGRSFANQGICFARKRRASGF